MEKFMLTPREACKCTGIGEKQIRDWAKNDTTFPALSVDRKSTGLNSSH